MVGRGRSGGKSRYGMNEGMDQAIAECIPKGGQKAKIKMEFIFIQKISFKGKG